MPYTKILEFTNIGEIENNASFYKKIFIEDGLIVFRNARLSNEDHVIFHQMLCKKFGAYEEENLNGYVEQHSRISDHAKENAKNDGIILTWHVEHPSYKNPIVLGSWNMHKFTAQEESGKTYFVDTEALFNMMPDNFKDFAKKCIVVSPVVKNEGVGPTHKFIDSHWITGNLVIRVSHINETGNDYQMLHTFDGAVPTKEEHDMYDSIMQWIQNQLANNLDIRIVHKWRQGDLVIPDMYKMCHAVSGGFKSEEREFKGIWGRQYKNDNRN